MVACSQRFRETRRRGRALARDMSDDTPTGEDAVGMATTIGDVLDLAHRMSKGGKVAGVENGVVSAVSTMLDIVSIGRGAYDLIEGGVEGDTQRYRQRVLHGIRCRRHDRAPRDSRARARLRRRYGCRWQVSPIERHSDPRQRDQPAPRLREHSPFQNRVAPGLQAGAVLGSTDGECRREAEARRRPGTAGVRGWLAQLRALHHRALGHAREPGRASHRRRARGTLTGRPCDAAVRDLLAVPHERRGEQIARPVRRAQRVRRRCRIAVRRTRGRARRDRRTSRGELEDALTARPQAVGVARAVPTALALLTCSEAHVARGALHLWCAAGARGAFHAGVCLVATRGTHEVAEVDVTRLRGRTSALRLDVTRLGGARRSIRRWCVDRRIGLGRWRVLRFGRRGRTRARGDRSDAENERQPGEGGHHSNLARIAPSPPADFVTLWCYARRGSLNA